MKQVRIFCEHGTHRLAFQDFLPRHGHPLSHALSWELDLLEGREQGSTCGQGHTRHAGPQAP